MTLPERLPETDRDERFVPCAYHPAQKLLMLYNSIPLCETCYQHVLSDVITEARIQQLVRGGGVEVIGGAV